MKQPLVFLFCIIFAFQFSSPAQGIIIPNGNNHHITFEKVIAQEKNFSCDLLSLKKHLKPLLDSPDNDFKTIGFALLANGYTNCDDRLTPKSHNLYLHSIKTAKENGQFALLIWTQLNYVKAFYRNYQYKELVPYLQEVIANLEKAGNDNAEIIFPAETYRQIGWIKQTFTMYAEAEYYLKLALQHSKPDTEEYTSLLDAYGLNLTFSRKNKEALTHFEKAQAMALKINDSLRYAKILGNKAIAYQNLKQFDRAIPLLQQDINISERIGATKNTVFASIILARLYVETQEIDKAATILEQAEAIAVSRHYYKSQEFEILKLRLKLLKHTPNPELELLTRRRLNDLDSVLKVTEGEELVRAIKWQIQKDRYQNRLKQASSLIVVQEMSKRLYIALAIAVLLLSFLIYFMVRRKHKREKRDYETNFIRMVEEKKQIEDQLNATDHQLSAQIQYLKSKNQQIKKLKAEIEAVKQSSLSNIEEHNGKLNELLNSHLMTEESWLDFKREFEKEHHGFVQKLFSQFPELTDSNLRIIYLQKLGFENTAISAFLGITPDAIKKSKQRLKKKLNERYATLNTLLKRPL